jgi:L-ascorbate metabolism protein UlaG (beta-lactamase superfamily)
VVKIMKIKFLAHASFLITSDLGTKIVTDPFTSTPELGYTPIKESADIVTVSHGHGDHNNVKAVSGNPRVIDKPGKVTVKGVEVNGMAAFHDDEKGAKRGNSIIFCFKVDGMNVCHLGDLGHNLDISQVATIGKTDVLFIPVGGFFTIDARVAGDVASQINPKMIVPMHYLTSKVKFPIKGVEEFLKGKAGVKRSEASEIEISANTLPAMAQIVVLRPALL